MKREFKKEKNTMVDTFKWGCITTDFKVGKMIVELDFTSEPFTLMEYDNITNYFQNERFR